MTEEEAKTKWCPQFRNTGDFYADNRDSGDSHCIASDCMWWVEDEWSKTQIEGQEGHYINEPCGHCGVVK